MPKEVFDAFMTTFAKLPQRIVCKWEGEAPANVPSNVLMSSWLPQQDLLGKEVCKIVQRGPFITTLL